MLAVRHSHQPVSLLDRLMQTAVCVLAAGSMLTAWPEADVRASEPPRPNFVYIFSDQQHWQAMGFEDPFFATPNLDRFAADATVFERAFCSTPQCSPSRASMMTGLYPSKTGVMGNVGAAGGAKLAQKTIGAMLQEAGYDTAYYGKWHLGNDPAATSGWNDAARDAKDETATTKALAFLRSDESRKKPFLLVVSYLNPHNIYQFRPAGEAPRQSETPLPLSWQRDDLSGKPAVQQEFMTADQGQVIWGTEKSVWQAYRQFYREKVQLYDAGVGQILEALRAAGQWEKTIVILSADHGDMDTHHRLIFKGPFMYDQMIRVPLLVRVPQAFGGTRRGRINDYDVVNVDLVPTIRDFAGLPAIATDGMSLQPLLTGATNPPRRQFVIAQYYGKQQWVNPIRTIRTAQYKYTKYLGDGEELYDLQQDPEEVTNLVDDPKLENTKERLASQLDQWIAENHDPFYSLKTTPHQKGRGD